MNAAALRRRTWGYYSFGIIFCLVAILCALFHASVITFCLLQIGGAILYGVIRLVFGNIKLKKKAEVEC